MSVLLYASSDTAIRRPRYLALVSLCTSGAFLAFLFAWSAIFLYSVHLHLTTPLMWSNRDYLVNGFVFLALRAHFILPSVALAFAILDRFLGNRSHSNTIALWSGAACLAMAAIAPILSAG